MILHPFNFPAKKVVSCLPLDCRSLTVKVTKSPSLWPKSIFFILAFCAYNVPTQKFIVWTRIK